ncbi:MAG: group II intron reverse transcriptase/maturase, partial [Saccharospirillum sp.]|nr:group II intron reverse transcriptase/maturase [Saccharospirillum sp.]
KKQVRERWSAKQSLCSKELVRHWRMYILGWWAYFGIAKVNLKGLSAWTRRHVRKCFWQRWHSRKGRRRNLRMLGVNEKLIRRTHFHANAWKAARHPSMHTALNNETLRRYGIVTPDVLAVR